MVNNSLVIPIKEINFDVLSNEETLAYSVTDDSFNGLTSEDLKNGGVLDPRLGTTSQRQNCDTCGAGYNECQCHQGHIRLPVKVYNKTYKEMLRSSLSCLCYNCMKIPLKLDNKEFQYVINNFYGKNRVIALKALVKNVHNCPYCNHSILEILSEDNDDNIRLLTQFKRKNTKADEKRDGDNKRRKENIDPDILFSKLKDVSKDTVDLLGFDSSKFKLTDYMIHYFPVSSLCIRPTIEIDDFGNNRSHDDLTKKTANIAKTVRKIYSLQEQSNKQSTSKEQSIESARRQLQLFVFLINSNKSTNIATAQQNPGGVVMKSISDRIQGKYGFLRNNLEAKRVNFCARTVISSDPKLSIGEVGIPLKVAINVTIPVRVTSKNFKKLSQLVKNGRNKYPGANRVIPYGDKKHKDLAYAKNYKIKLGDIVERHIVDGDFVLMNRQPSLHRPSFMCHRVRVFMGISTFKLSVNVTTPYNADFDGDEMNMYAAQTIQTITENAFLMPVDKQIVSPTNSKPIIKFKQDTPAGLFKLTENYIELSVLESFRLLSSIKKIDLTKLKKQKMKTNQIFSFLIPDLINFDNGKVKIINGDLIDGVVTSSVLNQLSSYIWERYNSIEAELFIDNCQNLAEEFLLHNVLSVTLRDVLPTPQIKRDSKEIIFSRELEAGHLITQMENNPNTLDIETFEKDVFSVLTSAKEDVGKLVGDSLTTENNFYVMSVSGAKGSASNAGDMLGGRGQEVVKFRRLNKHVNGRMLPYFCFNDNTAKARGYITNSYHEGLDPNEYWSYGESGREGLVNTAIKTAETGYQQRRLIKTHESIGIKYDMTTRTANEIVLQFVYGDNNFDQTLQKLNKLPCIEFDNKEICDNYIFTEKDFDTLVKNKNLKKENIDEFKEINKNLKKEMIELRDDMRMSQLKTSVKYNILVSHFYQASNYKKIIDDSRKRITNKNEVLDVSYIIKEINRILEHENTPIMAINNFDEFTLKRKIEKSYKKLMRLYLYDYIGPKKCIFDYKFNKENFDVVVKDIIDDYKKTIVHPGDMVGILAAQAIGEPLTQMTLSSFHQAGAGVAGLQGTPRIIEIYGNAKTLATPIMFVYLLDGYNGDKTLVNRISSNLRYVVFKDIIEKIETLYEPYNLYAEEDEVDLNNIFSIDKTKDIEFNNNPWLYRIYIDKDKFLDYDIDMLEIKMKFIKYWNDVVNDSKNKDLVSNGLIYSSNMNVKNPVIYIRFNVNDVNERNLMTLTEIITESFYIKGTKNIPSIDNISNDNNLFYDKEGKIEKKNEYVIYTNGIDYSKIRKNKFIDQDRTICNDIRIVQELYGIEAARNLITRETDNVLNSNPNNTSNQVNYTHVALVADSMTHTGKITSIDRFGINKIEGDFLARASFENTMDIFTNAAINSEVDYLRSVSSRIMMGKTFEGGTCSFQLCLDKDKMEKTEFSDSDNNAGKKSVLESFNVVEEILENKEEDFFIP